MIYLGADHRGYNLKERVKKWLGEWKEEFQDEGAFELDSGDDYTLYSEKVGTLVADNPKSKGLLLCGSGVGADVAANKIDGVRASIGKSKEQVKAGRNDDDMNILVIAADYTKDTETKEILRTFLKTNFSGKERHKRRLEEIKRVETNN